MRLVPRSAAWRVGILAGLAFALAMLAIGYAVHYAVHAAFQNQLESSIRQTTASLVAEYRDDGLPGLSDAISARERSAANRLGFAIFDSGRRRIAGSLDTQMPQVGWQRIRFADPEEGPDPAMAFSTNMPDGNRLVVAADLEPVEAMDETVVAIFATGALAVLALGALLALGLTRYLKRRLETIAVGSRAFAAGDYSGRARVGSSDDEFDQLAQTLNSMLDRIAALLANLKQVTSDLAHDMRTPLTNLRNQLEGLLHAPAAERAARTDAAIEKCDDILRLFAAILRISELEGGELRRRFTGVDLGSLVKEIVEAHEPLAEESGHILVSADGAAFGEVSGDRELLAQALVNLVENALHHTSAGTNIEIGTVAGSVAPVLYVRDDGPGIAEAYRDRVTQRFVRLDASRSSTGHGLGLSMVKAIATAHGAEMELRDANPGLEVRIVFGGSGV